MKSGWIELNEKAVSDSSVVKTSTLAHEITVHDMGSNPSPVKLRVCSTFVLSCT